MTQQDIELLHVFVEKIKVNDNFSYIRFGDAELMCMSGTYKGHTKDKHDYSKELSQDLNTAFLSLCNRPDTYMGKWDTDHNTHILLRIIERESIQKKFVGFHLLDSDKININEHQYLFYKTIKESKRKKIFVANDGLTRMTSFLNIDEMITIPKINAYNAIEGIKQACLQSYVKDAIYIYCAGMNTKLLINEMTMRHPDSTHIDVGSAFEPFYNNRTRSGHASNEYLQTFFKDLL